MDEDPGGFLGALCRPARAPGIQEEVNDLVLLYALNGVPDVPAARAVVELYSPPRVTAELKKMRQHVPGMRLVPGATFDLQADENGEAYDVLKASDRASIRDRIKRDKPFLVVGSPKCTDYCWYNTAIHHKRWRPPNGPDAWWNAASFYDSRWKCTRCTSLVGGISSTSAPWAPRRGRSRSCRSSCLMPGSTR